MSFLALYANGFCLSIGGVAKCKWNVVAKYYLLIFWGEREVLFEPSHLRGVQFARRIIGLALGEETIVDAYIVLIATVEGIVGRSEVFLPFAFVE